MIEDTIFVDGDWLCKFLDKEGQDCFNSLVMSQTIVTNCLIIRLPFDFAMKDIKRKLKK